MSDFVQRVFIHNAGIKVVSVMLAIGLWLVVARDPIAEVEMSVPIEFQNIPNGLEIDSANSTQVQLRIRGPERTIHQLRPADVHAEINLATVRPGERTFDLSSSQIRVPQDLEVVQIIPAQFHLSFDNRETRNVEVRPRVIGTFASGMRVMKVTADPSQVTISGPRHRVDAVDAAITDPVDASGVLTQSTFLTHAYVTDPLIQVAHPTSVRVTVIMEGLGDQKNRD